MYVAMLLPIEIINNLLSIIRVSHQCMHVASCFKVFISAFILPESRKSHGSTTMSRRKVSQIYVSFEEGPAFFKKSILRQIMMHAKEVILHGKWRGNIGSPHVE